MINEDKIKKIHEFIDRLFERSKNPIEELNKIYDIHPFFFACKGCVEYINMCLLFSGYQINPEVVSKLNGTLYSCWHYEEPEPVYGPCNGPAYPVGCGRSGGYSDGYSGGCFGVGGGFCMSENKADKKLVLIIKRKDSKKNIGDNDIYGGVAY